MKVGIKFKFLHYLFGELWALGASSRIMILSKIMNFFEKSPVLKDISWSLNKLTWSLELTSDIMLLGCKFVCGCR